MVLEDGAFGRWLGHGGGALMNGISDLISETLESPFTPFLYVRTVISEPGSPYQALSARALILHFLASRMW